VTRETLNGYVEITVKTWIVPTHALFCGKAKASDDIYGYVQYIADEMDLGVLRWPARLRSLSLFIAHYVVKGGYVMCNF
jgi:hypothetical protein